ncbi:MAG: tetratricopeptide repeat protein [Desulfobaccales bacterium]
MQAKTQWVRVLLAQGQFEEAGELVAEVLEANPTDMSATLLQGLIALARKDGLQAVNNLRLVTQDESANYQAWLLLARAYNLNKEPEQAKDAAREALGLKKDDQEARAFLYGLYLQKKDYDGAIREIKGYLQYNENDISNLNFLGEVYLLKKDYGKAQDTFQKIGNLQPKNSLRYYQLGLLYRVQGQPWEALKYFELALAQFANYLPALQQEVAIDLEQKHADKALERVKQALARSPLNPQIHQMLGELLLLENQPEEAAAALEDSLSIYSGNTRALELLLVAYQKEADPEQVARQLKERVADPSSPKFYSLVLAILYERQKKFDKARELLEALLKQDLFPDLARNDLAYLLAEHSPTPEGLDQALKLASESLEDFPNDPTVLDTLGWVLCKKGDFAKARPYLEKAAAGLPNNPENSYHFGVVRRKNGRRRKSPRILKENPGPQNRVPGPRRR